MKRWQFSDKNVLFYNFATYLYYFYKFKAVAITDLETTKSINFTTIA